MSITSRRKGRRGETTAKRMLQDRDYTILADTTAGISADDLIVQDADGNIWSVEVKNQKTICPERFETQARLNRTSMTRQRWMVLAHIHGTTSWLVLKQGERPTVWHEKPPYLEGGA